MPLTVATAELVAMLADVALFAHPDPGPLNGVYLHEGRAPVGEDSQQVRALSATASNRSAAGHAVIPADGTLDDVLLTVEQVRAVIAVFAPLAKVPKDAPPHTVQLRRRPTGNTGHELHITEAQLLFADGGPELTLPLVDPDGYPMGGITDLFDAAGAREAGRRAGVQDRALSVRTDLDAGLLAAFTKVGKARGWLRFYRWHQDRRLLVQAGDRFTGVLMPVVYRHGEATEPDAAVLFPERVDRDTGELPPEEDEAVTATVQFAGSDEQHDITHLLRETDDKDQTACP